MRRATDLIRWLLFGNALYNWAAAGGAVALMTLAHQWWTAYPHAAGALLLSAALLLVSSLWGFAAVPKHGTCWPPWWGWWYRHPRRRVAWRFGCVLGVSELPLRGFVVSDFHCSFKVNRDRIVPKRLYLESGTGRRIDCLIQVGPAHRNVAEIEYIPAGTWDHCSARVLKNADAPDDGQTNHPTREEFIAIFDDLTLIFEYDTAVFRKHFSQNYLKRVIDFCVDQAAPKPVRQAVLKGHS